MFLFGMRLEPDLAGMREWIKINTSLQLSKGLFNKLPYIVYKSHYNAISIITNNIVCQSFFYCLFKFNFNICQQYIIRDLLINYRPY